MCFFSWNIDIEQNLMLIPCAYILFTEKFILQEIQEHSLFFTWRHRYKKCKIYVTTYRSCLWGLIIIRSRQRDVLINNIEVKFFEKYLWWSSVFVKFACNAFLLLDTSAMFHHIILLNNFFVEHLTKVVPVFWKARENIRETSGIIRQISNSNM